MKFYEEGEFEMKKALATGLVMASLIGTLNMPVFAETSSEAVQSSSGTTSSASESENHCQKFNLTPEQKAEWKAKIENSQKKWSEMTDAQKNEIYELMDKQIDTKIQLIDKYAEDGIIDKETADKMKARLTESKTKIRESGKMPWLKMGR